MVTRIYVLKVAGGAPRYIGKTIYSLRHRLARHIREAKREHHHRAYWISKCLRDGQEIAAELLEEVDGDGADRERFWISEYRRLGHDLVNSTDGGEGVPGLVFSPESRAKMSESHKAVMSSSARRAVSSATAKRIWDMKSEEEKVAAIRKMSDVSRKNAEARRSAKAALPPRASEVPLISLSDRVKLWHASRSPEEKAASIAKRKRTLAMRTEGERMAAKAAIKARRSADFYAAHSDRAKRQWAALTQEAKREVCCRISQGRLRKKRKDQ